MAFKKKQTFAVLNKFLMKYICNQNCLQNIKQRKNWRQALLRCFWLTPYLNWKAQ